MIGAGDLNERITIRRPTNTKNAQTGGLVRSWQTVGTVWAKIRSLNGREAMIGQVLQGISAFEIIVRYRRDLEVSDQVLWNGRELNIVAPPEDRAGKKQWLWITASTLAPQGA